MAFKGSWGNQGAWGAAGKGGLQKKVISATPAVNPAVAKAKGPEIDAKVAKLTKEVDALEKIASTTLEASKVVMENEKATPNALKASTESVEKQQLKLSEVMKMLSQESAETRKLGPSLSSQAGEFTKLLGRIRAQWQIASKQLSLLKPRATKAQAEADNKAKEIKDAAAFKTVLAKVKTEVTSADNAANAVTKKAAPLVASPPEDGEEKDKKVEEVQTAALEAIKKLEATRSTVTENIKAAQTYAPEAKKAAIAALVELQKKVNDGIKQLTVYKVFKNQLPRLAENQKLVGEITEKLSGHESNIAKATDLSKAASLTKTKVNQIDELLNPIKTALKEVNPSFIKLRNTDAVTQDKVAKLKTKQEELKTKCDGIMERIKAQRDAIISEEGIDKAKELLEDCEKVWSKCSDAEMPFLMGVEMLPTEQNDAALEACKEADAAATAALRAAKSHITSKMGEAKTFEKELQAATIKELAEIQKQVHPYDAKFRKFKQELAERKVLPLIAEAIDAVADLGKQVKAVEADAKALSAPGFEDESVEILTASIEKVKTGLDEAQSSGNSTRKIAQKKADESGAKQEHPSIVQINNDLQESYDKMGKLKNILSKAQHCLKSKKALVSGEEKVKEAEAAVKNAKSAVPAEGQAFTVETVKAVDEAISAADKAIVAAAKEAASGMRDAPAKVKADLEKLLERKKAAQETLNEVKSSAKDRREGALSAHYVAEAEAKTKAAEDACAKMDEAEGPFLVGNAMGSSKATKEILEKCTVAAKAVTEALTAARTYMAPKTKEALSFGEDSGKKVKEGFASMQERIKKVSSKHVTFEKDSKDRARDARMVEAGELADELTTLVAKVVEAAGPFTKEGGDKLSEAEAEKPLEAFLEVDKECRKQTTHFNGFLSQRRQENKDKDVLETIKKLEERLAKFRQEVAEVKKATAPHEKRALGKRLLAEAKEQVATLDGEVKKATEACAPLLEHGGEQFLVDSSLLTLKKILMKHMKEKSTNIEDVFKSIKKGKPAGEKEFTKWLTDLPQTIEKDELSAVTDERRVAMFKKLASGKGVTADDFNGLFKEKAICSKATALTDKLEVDGSETLCKVEPNTDVELSGAEQEVAGELIRRQCSVDGKTGWVTVRQGKHQQYFRFGSNAYKIFCNEMEKALGEHTAAVHKVASSLQAKMKQGGTAEEGSGLKEAREEMAKLKEEVNKATKALSDLKKNAADAKSAHHNKETAEKTAHIEAKNLKEAAPFLEAPKAKIADLEASANAAEEAAAPMVSLSPEELKTFATPAAVQEAVEEKSAGITEKAEAVREAIKEQLKAVSEVSPQSGGTALAKKELAALKQKVEVLVGKAKKASVLVTSKCRSLVAGKMNAVADAIRTHASDKKKTVEELFDSLKKGDKIPEAAFCKMLEALEVSSGKLSADLAKLVCRKLEADGISKEKFMNYVVLYFKVTRTIAFTDNKDIGACKTLRKADEGEVVEVLEGPVHDEANGMTRIRAKSLKKDDTTEGWITVSGSKGTAFLEKCSKPAA